MELETLPAERAFRHAQITGTLGPNGELVVRDIPGADGYVQTVTSDVVSKAELQQAGIFQTQVIVENPTSSVFQNTEDFAALAQRGTVGTETVEATAIGGGVGTASAELTPVYSEAIEVNRVYSTSAELSEVVDDVGDTTGGGGNVEDLTRSVEADTPTQPTAETGVEGRPVEVPEGTSQPDDALGNRPPMPLPEEAAADDALGNRPPMPLPEEAATTQSGPVDPIYEDPATIVQRPPEPLAQSQTGIIREGAKVVSFEDALDPAAGNEIANGKLIVREITYFDGSGDIVSDFVETTKGQLVDVSELPEGQYQTVTGADSGYWKLDEAAINAKDDQIEALKVLREDLFETPDAEFDVRPDLQAQTGMHARLQNSYEAYNQGRTVDSLISGSPMDLAKTEVPLADGKSIFVNADGRIWAADIGGEALLTPSGKEIPLDQAALLEDAFTPLFKEGDFDDTALLLTKRPDGTYATQGGVTVSQTFVDKVLEGGRAVQIDGGPIIGGASAGGLDDVVQTVDDVTQTVEAATAELTPLASTSIEVNRVYSTSAELSEVVDDVGETTGGSGSVDDLTQGRPVEVPEGVSQPDEALANRPPPPLPEEATRRIRRHRKRVFMLPFRGRASQKRQSKHHRLKRKRRQKQERKEERRK